MTAGRVGSRKSILATGRILPRRRQTQAVLQNAGDGTAVPPTHRIAVVYQLRRARRWLVFVLGGVALALLPWSGYLGASLPAEHVVHHWDAAWVGFDLFEAAALIGTLVALLRGSPLLPLVAAVAGTALLTDAWFDLITAEPGRDCGGRPGEAVCRRAAARRSLLLDLARLDRRARQRRRAGFGSWPSAHIAASPTRREPENAARTGGSEAPSEGRTSR